ncbi:MAG: TatD family hydrolase [Gammaproteobacteria bacterium]|nr:TatD family hydrolase [Gammaproteobacteria bacterium]
MHLVDTHCHLNIDSFSADLDAVLERAQAAGILEFIVPAITRSGWEHLRTLTEQYPSMYPAYGLHPMFMDKHRVEHTGELDQWLDTNSAIAVGECGLDYYLPEYDSDAQLKLLKEQLVIARNHKLPVIIHCRKAMDQVLKLLREIQPLTGVLHSFNGSLQQAEQALELGFIFGIGGPVTYDRASKMHALVRQLPQESLLLETDAPDQPVSGHQGERNEPSLIINILHALAEIREEPVETVATYTTANAHRLFKLT